jgi:hypothetical protein
MNRLLTGLNRTGIAGVVTAYALTDMILYNRKKKRQYFEEQRALEEAALHNAQVAQRNGTASQEQLELLRSKGMNKQVTDDTSDVQKIAAAVGIAKESGGQKSEGLFASAKNWLFGSLKNEEEGDDFADRRLGYEGTSEDDDVYGTSESDILKALEAKKQEVEMKAKRALERERRAEKEGGPLDRLGTENEGQAGVKGGWTSFMNTRK